MNRIDEIFGDIVEIEKSILGEEKYLELVDRYSMKADLKRDEQKDTEIFNWDER